MRSITYAGNDFSDLCAAEVIARSANPIIAEYLEVPGRAGALLLSGYVPPVDVRVKLFLDPGFDPGRVGLAQVRSRLRAWLCRPEGGALVLPDDPEIEYRDALLVGASDWSDLFECGSCTLTFTLFDPIGYGRERVERGASFSVGGTWPTLPEFALTAEAGSCVEVALPAAGKRVRLDWAFAGGEAVVLSCDGETATVDGADARAGIALASDFFALDPGDVAIEVAGCSSFETRFCERWV